MANLVRPVLGGLLVAVVLLLNALASSPSLHERFHADAGKVEHQCAITLFAHGLVDAPVVDVAAVIPAAPAEFLPLTSVLLRNAPVDTLPPGRAPPVSSVNS